MGFFRRALRRTFYPINDQWREEEIQRERMQEAILDYILRLTELILICGAIVFVEKRLGAGSTVSTIVAACVAYYGRVRASAAMLELMRERNLDPRRQALVYWLITGLAILLWGGIVAFTNTVVPMIAKAQGVAG